MLRIKSFNYAICILFVLSISAIAADDTAATATSLPLNGSATGVVSPTDKFDYYYFEIPELSVASGTITMESQQVGTTMKIKDSADQVCFDTGTTNSTKTLIYTLPAEGIKNGRYNIRIGFYSNYAYDHDYKLTLDIQLGVPQSEPRIDVSKLPTPGELSFEMSVAATLDVDHHLDLWHFTINDRETEGKGIVSLSCSPGELVLYLFDSTKTQLYSEVTSGGELKYTLSNREQGLAPGDYYLAVFLPLKREDTTTYSLSLNKAVPMHQFKKVEIAKKPEMVSGVLKPVIIEKLGAIIKPGGPPTSPWPMRRFDAKRNGRSTYNGPQGKFAPIKEYDLKQELNLPTPYYKVSYDIGGLTVGPDGMLYFMHHQKSMLYAYDIYSGMKWNHVCFASIHSAPLDDTGHVYVIEPDKVTVECLNPDGTKLSSFTIPGDPAPDRFLWTVGDTVCTSMFWLADKTSQIYARKSDGSAQWLSEVINGRIDYIAYDPNGFYYVQHDKNLMQLDNYGKKRWDWLIYKDTNWWGGGIYDEWPNVLVGNMGPIIGPSGRVYVNNVLDKVFRVFDVDGSLYKKTLDASSTYTAYALVQPYAACLGSDGKFYIADYRNQVTCLEDWTTEKWHWSISGTDVKIYDMVLGGDNKIYIAYAATTGVNYRKVHVVSLDSVKGTVICDCEIQIPDDYMLSSGELAIAGLERLVYLNAMGRLVIFGPV